MSDCTKANPWIPPRGPETYQITINPILFSPAAAFNIEWVNIASHLFFGDPVTGSVQHRV